MKAELITGEIVTLEKECNCINHNEPHWVHMDRVHRERNRELLNPDGKSPEQRYYVVMGIAKEEIARLDEKMSNFKRLGIARLIPESTDELSDIQRQHLKQHYENMLPPELSKPAPEYLDQKTQIRIEAKERL